MIPCPQCGSQLTDGASFCGVCGHVLASAAARPGVSKKTMLGFVSPLAAPNAAPNAAPAPAPEQGPSPPGGLRGGAKTMMGIAAPLPMTPPTAPERGSPLAPPTPDLSPPSLAPAPTAFGKGKTMIGVAAPLQPQPQSQPAPAPRVHASNKTLLGVAPVVGPGAPAAAPQRGDLPVAHGKGKTMIGMPAPQLPSPGTSPRKTLMGVALSSLMAPLSPVVTEPEYVEEFYDEVVPETGQVERRVRMVQKPLPPIHRRPGFYLLLGAPVVLAAGVAALWMMKRPAPVTAEARLDSEGNDLLHITCASCPDGTLLSLPGAAPVKVQGNQADLRLPARLKVGNNPLELAIDRPEHGRDEAVQLSVPVAYRLTPELGSLQDTPATIRVAVEAVVGASVSVQGQKVPLDASGRGVARVEVQAELLAMPLSQKVFRREIPYTITTREGKPEEGKLGVQMGVVPLTLESPGSNLVTDQATFLMAGYTQKGAGLTVSGAAVVVGPDGEFRQHLKIPGLGLAEVPLRVTAAGMAPRLVSLKVKLVQSLQAEARSQEGAGKPGYDEVQGKLASAAGTAVAWRGKVLSASGPGNRVVAVLDVQTGCARHPCPARVQVPGGGALALGDRVAVYGRVLGAAPDQGREVPDIEVDFLVRQP
ncbi:MAG: zinc ribbon domain-containing protein [Polyangiaceae bacterium]|nr:zinc ribbon domain-containing protein [Polyangiaceae bacterium]